MIWRLLCIVGCSIGVGAYANTGDPFLLGAAVFNGLTALCLEFDD